MQAVDQLRRRGCSVGQNAQPSEWIDALENLDAARRNRISADAVKAVTPGDEIAADFAVDIVVGESDSRLFGFHILHADIRYFEKEWPSCGATRGNQILDDFVLAIDGNPAARQRRHIDAAAPPVHVEIDSVMEHRFALKPGADAALHHEIDCRLLQNTGANTLNHVILRLVLDDDGIDTRQMEQVSQHQAGRTRAHNADLSSYRLHKLNDEVAEYIQAPMLLQSIIDHRDLAYGNLFKYSARMKIRHILAFCAVALLFISNLFAAGGELADAVMKGNKDAVRTLLQRKADVNAAQIDGTTALHWAVRANDVETVDLLLRAGANVSVRNREGVMPLELAALNGSAAILERLTKTGADANAPLNSFGDTALMMASRSGKADAVKVLLDRGAQIDAKEKWGDTTALMWAVSEGNREVVKLLIDRGADVNVRTKFVPSATGRGFEGATPVEARANQAAEENASGLLTPLMFAAREGDLGSARMLVAAGAQVNAVGGDGKDVLGLAVFNGSYDVASFLIDQHADVNKADAQRFTPLFWAVDRRNMETAPNFPWVVTADPLPLIKKLLDAGANVNWVVNNTPRARMRDGSPRIVFATAVMRAAFSGDVELVKLLLAHGADLKIVSRDSETPLMAACGTGFIPGYSKGRTAAERLETVKLLVELGQDVNAADDYGITALMVAANIGDVPIIQYLIDKGADLSAYDLGKKNDGAFGSSIEPLMPIDYAIGVGTFRPNNAIVFNEDAVKLMSRIMQERGIKHTTSECTLRGFTCSIANVDPKTATPAQIQLARRVQTGYQVDGVTGGLGNKEQKK